jgi:ferredoxin
MISMQIRLDWPDLFGLTQCYATSPTVFPIGDTGYPTLDEKVVASSGKATVRDEVAACPELALLIELDDRWIASGRVPDPPTRKSCEAS